jgi:uncharacterized protein YjbI with pentapeptide repeats
MIQVHDPMAVIVVESVLIAVALAAAHRATEGRLWGWLRSGLAIRAGFRRIAIGLMTLPAGAVAVGLAADGVHPAADLAARFLMGVLAMIVVLAFCLLRAHRLAHEARARDYRHRIDALKGSAAAEAGPAVRTLILALNRCGVTDVNLTCCRLPGADLSRTKLYKARLRGAELKGADLSRVGFTGADLSGARLNDAVLCEAFAYRANLRDADLSRADLRGADLRDADLRGARLDGCLLADARLEGARLDGASFRAARFKNTQVSVDQLLKTSSLAHARLDPSLHARLTASYDPVPGLARRLLRLDGIIPLPD